MEKKMTKKAMIDYIEESHVIRNFSRSYLIHLPKKEVEWFYNKAIEYNRRKQNQ